MDDEVRGTLQHIFSTFDQSKSGFVETNKFGDILDTLGTLFTESELKARIKEIDTKNSGKVDFDNFCKIVTPFIEEEEEEDVIMMEELKEAFRLYDKEGNGYISTDTLKEILKELDSKLTEEDLEEAVEEIDEDGSGTVDFDEFKKMMTG